MLGQPMAMLIPEVVGFELTGQLPPGATATDLVLTVTQMLRKKGVVDKFVEFTGAGIARAVAARPRDDREHGARVRRDDGLLPGRRRDARVPALHRPPRRARRSSSSATARRTCSGTTRRAKLRFSDTLSLDLVDRRAVARRPGAAAGSRAARSRRAARGARRSAASSATRPARRAGDRARGPTTAAPRRPAALDAPRRSRPTRARSRSATARS